MRITEANSEETRTYMQVRQDTPVGLEISANKRFGENVRMFLTWNVLDRNLLRPNQLSNEVEPQADVLGPGRAKGVGCQSDSPIDSANTLKHFLSKGRNDERQH